MKINFHKIIFFFLSIFLLNFSIVEAKCKFIMDLGGRYIKFHEKKYGPLPEDDTGYAEVEFLAPDLCPNDNFDDNFIIRHIFLDKKLMAILFYVNNSIDNSATESLKLMNYAKRNYGDFDTGGNPNYFNNFHTWERVRKFIIYDRNLSQETWREEIYISNDKFWDQLSRHTSLMEMGGNPDEDETN